MYNSAQQQGIAAVSCRCGQEGLQVSYPSLMVSTYINPQQAYFSVCSAMFVP